MRDLSRKNNHNDHKNFNVAGVVLKRKNDHTDDESSLMAGGKASYKRIRVMSSTDSEDSLQVMEHLQHRSQSQEQCIEFLREAFPTLSSQVIHSFSLRF